MERVTGHAGESEVSVVVRSIGRPTLDRALASIAAQSIPSVEIVVVHASGAAHPRLPDTWRGHRITQVESRSRLARADAADAGIRVAHGRWLTFLDDDDELLPGHLRGLLDSAAAAPQGEKAVSGRAAARFRSGREETWGQRFALAELYQRNFIHLSTLLFHRSLLDAGIAFDRALPMHEDWDFALQIAQHTRFADWPRATFRWHADAGSSGGGAGGNADDPAFARHRDYVYAKWAPVRDAWLERCLATLQAAAAHAAAGRLGEAQTLAREVLASSQNDPHALNLLAMIALRRGDVAEARSCQSLAVEARPRDPDLRVNLARVHLAAGDRERARAELDAALALDPAHRGAAAGRAQMASEEPPRDAVRAVADVASRRAPSRSPPLSVQGSATARRADFQALERICATDASDSNAWSRLLQLFFALGQPDDLPGSTLRLPQDAPPPRVAVLTPYFAESIDLLERCHRSVRAQTLACEHVMVADGRARGEIDAWPVRHLRIPTPTRDFGDTPRRVAGRHADEAGFDAVVYLDADNWLRPHHVESLVACQRLHGAPVCHSGRTLHRLDGSLMPLVEAGDNYPHVDTSCLFVARPAFDLLPIWGSWPRELSMIDDRMFWHVVVARGHVRRFTGAFTTCYHASHAGFYRALGEAPPDGVRPDLDVASTRAWHDALPSDERAALDRRFGFAVGALLELLARAAASERSAGAPRP